MSGTIDKKRQDIFKNITTTENNKSLLTAGNLYSILFYTNEQQLFRY
jgi:hypothetical protein